MNEHEERIKKLEQEVVALSNTANTAVLMATSALELAYSLAATHQDPRSLLDVFIKVSAPADAHITYSKASDEQVEAWNKRREQTIALLSAGLSDEPQA